MTAYEKAEKAFLEHLRRDPVARREWFLLLEDEIMVGKSMNVIREKWGRITSCLIKELALKDDEDFGPLTP